MSFDLFNGGLMPTLSAKSSFLDSYIVVGIWSHLKRINICSLSYNWNGHFSTSLFFGFHYSIWVHSSCMNVLPENQWHCSVLIWLSHNCSNGASELQGIDILAGVEAIISHLVVKNFNIPCAHAPALLSAPLSASLCPKSASEEVSRIFLGGKKHIDLLHVFAVLLCLWEGNHGIFHIYSFVVSLGFWNSETTFGA